MTTKHARLAELPPSGPSRLPENHNDHHGDDDDESGESDFDESTVKAEGGLASKLESLDERAFEDRKKVALRQEERLQADGSNTNGHAQEAEEEEDSNAGETSLRSATMLYRPCKPTKARTITSATARTKWQPERVEAKAERQELMSDDLCSLTYLELLVDYPDDTDVCSFVFLAGPSRCALLILWRKLADTKPGVISRQEIELTHSRLKTLKALNLPRFAKALRVSHQAGHMPRPWQRVRGCSTSTYSLSVNLIDGCLYLSNACHYICSV